jgi:hypothetical protein
VANVVMSKQFSKDLEVDGSLRPRAWDFLTKLTNDHTQPGLHVEPIKGSADDRVRTARVTDNYRAVMFLVASEPEPQFVLAAIKKHDEANRLAERLILRINPVTGILEIETKVAAEPAFSAARAKEKRSSKADPTAGPLSVFSLAELTDVVGLSPAVAAAAIAAADEDELLSVADSAPAWQADALLSLATGRSPQDIAAELREAAELIPAQVTDSITTPEATEFERAYAHPASQMEFIKITDDEQLRQVVQGSFAGWRVFLHPEQRRYAYRDQYNGAFRLSGGAGTGKTVVALHRARFLARDPDARIVLTTYTTTLAENLRTSLRELDPELELASELGASGIYVVGVDKLARDVLTRLGDDAVRRAAPYLGAVRMSGDLALRDNEERGLWEEAVTAAGPTLSLPLRKPTFLSTEYRTVVLGNAITTRDEYARVARTGRGVRLSRLERLAIWDVIIAYRRGLAMTGRASFAELAAVAGLALGQANLPGGVGRPRDR